VELEALRLADVALLAGAVKYMSLTPRECSSSF